MEFYFLERVKQLLRDQSEPVKVSELVKTLGHRLEPSAKAWFDSRRREFVLDDRGCGSVGGRDGSVQRATLPTSQATWR